MGIWSITKPFAKLHTDRITIYKSILSTIEIDLIHITKVQVYGNRVKLESSVGVTEKFSIKEIKADEKDDFITYLKSLGTGSK